MDGNTGGRMKPWEKSINAFLKSLKSKNSDLMPNLSFGDKNISQRKSIQIVSSTTPYKWLRHIVWAIKGMVCVLRKFNVMCLNLNAKRKLLRPIDMHYSRSSISIDTLQTCLHWKALVELWSFCLDSGEDYVHKYFYRSWYRKTLWRLWGPQK